MTVVGTGRSFVEIVREEDDVPFMAASIAYYAVASFVPLLLVAPWSGSKVIRGLSIAFDRIYTRDSDLSLVDRREKSVLALSILLLGFLLLAALSIALTFVDVPIRYPTLLGNVLAVVVLCVAFLPIFYVMHPSRSPSDTPSPALSAR